MKIKKLKYKKSNKAQGAIIGTVLLILIVISIAIIVMTFVIPFVKNQLADTGCFDVVGQVSFKDNPSYTCFDKKVTPSDGSNDEIRLQVHVGDVNESLEGFTIVLEEKGKSKSIEIKDGTKDEKVKMFGKKPDGTFFAYSDPLELPGKNEERTYVFKEDKPDFVSIYPILKGGKTCEVSDTLSNRNTNNPDLDDCR